LLFPALAVIALSRSDLPDEDNGERSNED